MQKWLLVLDDLDRDVGVLFMVVGLDHLAEGALSDERVNLVAVEEALAGLNDVIVVLVIVALKNAKLVSP
jgi:hypothetical protein